MPKKREKIVSSNSTSFDMNVQQVSSLDIVHYLIQDIVQGSPLVLLQRLPLDIDTTAVATATQKKINIYIKELAMVAYHSTLKKNGIAPGYNAVFDAGCSTLSVRFLTGFATGYRTALATGKKIKKKRNKKCSN